MNAFLSEDGKYDCVIKLVRNADYVTAKVQWYELGGSTVIFEREIYVECLCGAHQCRWCKALDEDESDKGFDWTTSYKSINDNDWDEKST
jgi:hypothetical protein